MTPDDLKNRILATDWTSASMVRLADQAHAAMAEKDARIAELEEKETCYRAAIDTIGPIENERDAALARMGELTEALATARDDTLEEAATICAQNSGEVGRFVAAKGRVGDFFAMVLRRKKTEEGPGAMELLQRFADAAGCPDADGFGSIIERMQRWRDAIYASHKVVLSDQGDHCGVCGADVEDALDDGLVCPGAKIVRAGTGETEKAGTPEGAPARIGER